MNRRNIFLLVLCLIQFNLWADGEPCCGTDNRKAKKLYNKSVDLLSTRSLKMKTEAYKLLVQAVKLDETYSDANFILGEINFEKATKAKDASKILQFQKRAYKYFLRVVKNCESCNDFEASYYCGYIDFSKKDYEQAKEHLNSYLNQSESKVFKKEAEERLAHIKIYNDLLSHPVAYNPIKLEGVSTQDDEFLPMISPDGELVIFTHRYVSKDPLTKTETLVDELAISKRKSGLSGLTDVYSQGESMTYPFNEEGLDQGAMSMTINNKELYITICKMARSNAGPFKNCDIYVSYFKDDKWSALENLGPNINGKYSWESQPSISADGQRLYFASVRPENMGFDFDNNQSSDIYYSDKDENGNWTKAKNIGAPINTEGNEKSPFIHTDSRTLYFSSDLHPGLGGYDIFYAKETAEGWEQPTNIGYPINDKANDIGFFVSTNGKKAYFSSDKLADVKRWNIYSFDLYEEARPEKVIFAKGQLLDEEGNALTDAKVEIRTSSSDKVIKGLVDKETGNYAIAVSVQKDEKILMTVKKEGHAFSSKYFVADENVDIDEPLHIDMEVKKVSPGATVQINDIHFATNSAMFKDGSKFILDNFVSYLEEMPTVKLEIHGHTDDVGNNQTNQKLSEARAKSVRDYIISKGILADRITSYKGHGESKPIATNKTEEGRAKNRRTEFVIVGL